MADAHISDTSSNPTSNVVLSFYDKYRHLLNYLVIGGAASAIDVLVFMFLFNVLGTSALLAHSIAVPLSVIFSFTVNARHNFKTHDYLLARLASFVIVCTIGYLVGYGIIVLVASWGFGENIGKIASLPFVFIVQFILNSTITFRQSKASGELK